MARTFCWVLAAVLSAAFLVSCQSSEDGVVNKVMTDFGLKARPEGYVSDSDKIMDRLGSIGATELKRLNLAEQRGTVKFQQNGELHGKYYKEVKVYEGYFPTDVQPVSKTTDVDRGYLGYVDYTYRMYQSARKDSSAEAAALAADVPTDVTGRETYRYNLNAGGDWAGGKGERVRR